MGVRVNVDFAEIQCKPAPNAVRGWRVCRMHGARGGAPEGERKGNYRHGARTKEAIELTKLIRTLAKLHKGLRYILHGVDAYFDFVPSSTLRGTKRVNARIVSRYAL
jgi:hypothetical protein